MELKIYNKLVRDKIPEIIKAKGGVVETRVLNDEEYKKFLRLKLIEEVAEANEALTREDLVKELGDVWEVAEALMKNENIDLAEVQALKQKRREERGGFDERIFLIKS